jgi:hypothetical protein
MLEKNINNSDLQINQYDPYGTKKLPEIERLLREKDDLIKRLVDEVQNKTSTQNNNGNNSRSYEEIDREHLLRNMDDMQ